MTWGKAALTLGTFLVLVGCADGANGDKGVVHFSQVVNFVETNDFTPPLVVGRTVLLVGLGALVLLDQWTVDKRYMHNEKDKGRYVQWADLDDLNKPFTPTASDKAILEAEWNPAAEEAHQAVVARLKEEKKAKSGLAGDLDAFRGVAKTLELSSPETFVVNDTWQVAGTFDFLVRVGKHWRIGDLKTGTDLSYSWRSIAVQLATYANAEWIYNVDADERIAMPPIDKTRGVIVHLPAGEARCQLFEVDLDAGLEAAQRSLWTRNWRKAKVSWQIETPKATEKALEASLAARDAPPALARGLPQPPHDGVIIPLRSPRQHPHIEAVQVVAEIYPRQQQRQRQDPPQDPQPVERRLPHQRPLPVLRVS